MIVNNLKNGDKLVCIKTNVIIKSGKQNHIKNKVYTLIEIENTDGFYTVNGEIRNTSFYNNTFFKYFIPLQQYRKDKLDKLNKNANR